MSHINPHKPSMPYRILRNGISVQKLLTFAAMTICAWAANPVPAKAGEYGRKWYGMYCSSNLKKSVYLDLALSDDNKAGALKFKTIRCTLGLKLESDKSSNPLEYTVIANKNNDASGNYCGYFINSEAVIKQQDNSTMNLFISNNKSHINVTMYPNRSALNDITCVKYGTHN